MCSKNVCAYKHSNNKPTSSSSHEKDTASENSVKEYQFECAYCAFITDEYIPFMDQTNTNHLEIDAGNENDDVDKDNQA